MKKQTKKQKRDISNFINKFIHNLFKLRAEGKKECSIKVNQIPALWIYDNSPPVGYLHLKFPQAWKDGGFEYLGMWIKIIPIKIKRKQHKTKK